MTWDTWQLVLVWVDGIVLGAFAMWRLFIIKLDRLMR